MRWHHISSNQQEAPTRIAHVKLCVQVKCADIVRCTNVLWFVTATDSKNILCCHNNHPQDPMRNEDRRWEHCFQHVQVLGNVSGCWSDRWAPQVTLQLVLIQWSASVEEDQINTSIQATLQILKGSLAATVESSTSTELGGAGVKVGSCCRHGDSVMVPELRKNGDGVVSNEERAA